MMPILQQVAGLVRGGASQPPEQKISWDEVVGNAYFQIEAVKTDRATAEKDSENGAEAQTAASEFSREQLLNVSVQIDLPQGHRDTTSQTHLVLAVDRSGSMAGKPWTQVKDSVKELLGRSLSVASLKTEVIVYNDKADILKFQPSNYAQVVDDLKPQSTTNFKDAFAKIASLVKDAGQSYSRTIVVFMTDGCDTVNSAGIMPGLISNLCQTFSSINKDACVHAVGFSKDHNFEFLKNLAESGGTTPGMFRYCEPGENTVSLQQKLDELFDFILQNTMQPATLHVSVGGEGNYFISGPEKRSKVELDGRQEQLEGKKTFSGETWIHVEDLKTLPDLEVSLAMKIMAGGTRVVNIPCISSKPEVKVIEAADEKAAWQLRILTRNVEDLVTRTAAAIANKTDVSQFQERVEKYQRKISHTVVFGNGITKEGREAMFAILKEAQANLDRIQNMLAEYLRAGTDSISLLARAHDMRYQAVFSKNRRQRVMDKRVGKNMKYAQEAQNSLSGLKIDEQEVKGLSQEALQFYFCVLSQDSVLDVLQGDDKADAIGFGLAVKRSEVVLDEPSLIRLQVISGTLVSRNAMLDALEYQINVSSHLKAHGGFSFKDTPLGVTTVGSGREPINAWLPLYITKSHWDRVKVILKPALGSFCTLDPLGYHYKQLDVLFAVLGSMIGQLTERNVGEHQLRLLFAVQRTCAACLVDFDLHADVKELVTNFVASPEGRTKDIIPNLYTLIGYIVALPPETTKEIFCLGDGGSKLSGFWLGFIAELLRRAAGGLYNAMSRPDLHGLLNALLHGNGQDDDATIPACEAVSQLMRLCRDPANSDLDLHINPFDPADDVKLPTVTLKHDPEVDKAMDVWAQGQTGYLKNLSRNRKYKQATGVVKKWLKELSDGLETDDNRAVEVECPGHASGDDSDDDVEDRVVADDDDAKPDDGAGGVIAEAEKKVTEDNIDKEDKDAEQDKEKGVAGKEEKADTAEDKTEEQKSKKTEKAGQFEPQHVTGYMLKVVAQLLGKMCGGSFPGVQSLPGCIAFVENWLSQQHSIADLDTNSGLPPQAWVAEVRQAVAAIYRELKEFEGSDVQQSAGDGSGQESNVVTVLGTASTTDGQGVGQQIGIAPKKDVGSGEDNTVASSGDNDAAADDDDDADDYDYDYDDDDSEEDYDSYTAESRRQTEKKKQQAKRRNHALMPTLLRYLARDQDVILLLRAMLCQAVRFHSNSAARAAITNKTLLDLQDNQEARATTLCEFHGFLEEYTETVRKSLLEKAVWQQANHCMLHATTTWAFIGYLMNTHKSRLEGFSELVDLLFASTERDVNPPCLQDKVHILLTGKYEDLPVLDNGNQWLPEKKMATKFKTLLGPEIWMEFELELRSNITIHVYRESDIPNRHGHHNSNPYIPNALRKKLGMELLKEPGKARSRKKRK